MIQTKKVTLNPGEAQEVAFSYTPVEARTYYVTIDGLAGSFKAVAAVPAFSYSNLNLQIFRIPGEDEFYIDVQCDIKNIGGGGTREVSVWISNHNFYVDPSSISGYTWGKITSPSFAGWPSWAIPEGGLDWDAGTINLTLGPGEIYHFHYAGYGAAYHDDNWVQIRDDAGGESVVVKKYAPSAPAPAKFEYSDVSCSIYWGPYHEIWVIDLKCTITNIGDVPETRTIKFCFWPSWDVKPIKCYYNYETFNLTLQPGESFYYSSRNRGVYSCIGFGGDGYAWLHDSKGDESVKCHVSAPAR